MTRLILTALVLIPASASAACGTTAGGCATGHGCGALSTALMAAIAALGVWVLRSVEKDGVWVRRAGQAVGWTLAVVGLGGFLCGAASYGLKKRAQSCHAPVAAASAMTLPPGHPPLTPAGK
ncbi:MAG: hypothetical protein HYX59_00190 [Elusimicrobia bacterium]|nr:hypothetical protein [Elusimicrobiota bacterium]